MTEDHQSPDASPSAGSVDPVGSPPLTRRERRERERAEELRAEEPRAEQAVRREPPLIASPSRVTPPVQRSARRAGFGKGLSVLAMTFAAAIAVATSVPSMALLTQDDVRAAALQSQLVQSAAGSGQKLVSDPGSTVASITRDGTAITSAEQVAALSHMRIADTFTNDPLGLIQWPFPVGVPISDFYGARSAPTEGASTNHLGVDFAPGLGVPIQIIADGVVREVVNSDNGGCGVNVTIDHMIGGQLVSSKYCHMKAGSVRVATGQQVKVADTVGLVGNTGISTGAHLHFEILLNGTEHTDPLAWLKANAG